MKSSEIKQIYLVCKNESGTILRSLLHGGKSYDARGIALDGQLEKYKGEAGLKTKGNKSCEIGKIMEFSDKYYYYNWSEKDDALALQHSVCDK